MIIAIALTCLLPILLLGVMPVGAYSSLRSLSQTLHWEASFIIASVVSFVGYVRIDGILGPPLPIPAFAFWALKLIAIISPICIGVAWSRWQGVKWWLCLLLFLVVPIGMVATWLMLEFPFAS